MGGGDPDLDNLIPGFSTGDATVLEFDFECSVLLVISFQYVFTSEEYNEFVNSSYNDVFGFFLNGVNIALIPSTTTPVSINNVNGGHPGECVNGIDDDSDGTIDGADPDCSVPGDNIVGEDNSNSAFYINNDCSDPDGGAPCAINTEMDGLTVVLTATGAVNPGVNHIKLAIADAGDLILDSNVLIKAESFVCAPPSCAITDLAAGTQTPCVPATSQYTQEVIVTYSNPPGTGTLDVNGQSFPITGSPQSVTLGGLVADGAAVNVTASFSADPGCTLTENALFTAPAPCPPCAITDLAAGRQTPCVPATNHYTQKVIVTYSNPPGTGTLDVNGRSFPITGSPQSVSLRGLVADGAPVDVTASFSADPGCTLTENALFTAPTPCPPCVEGAEICALEVKDDKVKADVILPPDFTVADIVSAHITKINGVDVDVAASEIDDDCECDDNDGDNNKNNDQNNGECVGLKFDLSDDDDESIEICIEIVFSDGRVSCEACATASSTKKE